MEKNEPITFNRHRVEQRAERQLLLENMVAISRAIEYVHDVYAGTYAEDLQMEIFGSMNVLTFEHKPSEIVFGDLFTQCCRYGSEEYKEAIAEGLQPSTWFPDCFYHGTAMEIFDAISHRLVEMKLLPPEAIEA